MSAVTSDVVAAAGAAVDAARAALAPIEALGASVNAATFTGGRPGVTIYANTSTYGYRGAYVGGRTDHRVNGGIAPDPRRHRKAAAIAAKVDAMTDELEAFVVATIEHNDTREAWDSLTFWHVMVDGQAVERHASERGATIGAARHPGATILAPIIPGRFA